MATMPAPRVVPLALAISLAISLAVANVATHKGLRLPLAYRNTSKSVDERVADLLGRMTLAEKMGQLVLPFGAHYPIDYVKFNQTGLGATYPLPSGVDVEDDDLECCKLRVHPLSAC